MPPINLHKTLEQLDGLPTHHTGAGTYVEETMNRLRKKPLKDFTIEEIRLMASQDHHPAIILPMAIEQLKKNILAEGDFYPGDLLQAVLSSDNAFWKENKEHWLTVINLYKTNKEIFESNNLYRNLRRTYEQFFAINA
jgi:hypothetical protein